ncbi:MAG: hypothetical protein M3O09_00805 [Acidobacteriota bacterium]|nr:hypothetical protein [Acidobacteriota bacterium]
MRIASASWRSFLLVALAAISFSPHSLAQEKKIKRSDLPPAVDNAVSSLGAGARISGFAEEREKGQTFYEVQMVVDGHTKDVLLDRTGAVVEVEEEVALDKLPDEVKQGLMAKAKQGKLTKVESLTKHGKLVAYEAQVMTGRVKSEVQVGPEGIPLDHEE